MNRNGNQCHSRTGRILLKMQTIRDAIRTPARALTRDVGPGDWKGELERWSLIGLIVDAVRTVDWPESDLKLTAQVGFTFRPLLMLTILTYCHATGVNRSKEIELTTRQDEVLRSFCTGSYPTWREIEDFRRSHRELICQSLAVVLRRARRCPGKFSICRSGGRSFNASKPSDFVRDADARIQQAIFLDAMAVEA